MHNTIYLHKKITVLQEYFILNFFSTYYKIIFDKSLRISIKYELV